MIKYENKELSVQEAIDTRENLIVRARELNEKALSEKRDLTAEEKTSYDKMKADIRTLLDGINAEKRSAELDGFSKAIPLSEPEERNAKRDGMEEFRNYLRTGERRDLIIDGVSQTASALAPKEFVEEIIKSLQKETQLVGRVRTIPLVKAQAIDVPKETAEISDASFTTETGTIAADSQQAFGTVTLGADRVGKLVKVSKKAVLSSAFDVSSLVSEELSYKLRCALENAILNGTGSGQPTGIFATSGANALTAANVDVTASSATAFSADDIIKTKRKVKSAYRANAVWVLHPDIVTDALLLKDKNDQYLWRSGLLPGDPDILDGSPVIESEFAPNTKTTGLYVGCYGDFSKYWMTILEQISIQVLMEKYAENGFVGYLAETFAGGAPINEGAFSRLVLA